jgi:hypothetical protein
VDPSRRRRFAVAIAAEPKESRRHTDRNVMASGFSLLTMTVKRRVALLGVAAAAVSQCRFRWLLAAVPAGRANCRDL